MSDEEKEKKEAIEEHLRPLQYITMTSYDQWMRRLLLLVALCQIGTALYAINRIDRNFSAGNGNRAVNCAILREISKTDPQSFVILNENCR